MHIQLNGQRAALPASPCTITDLLTAQGLAERRVAVEVNGEIVPRGQHDQRVLHEGDTVEIVHALGGG
jgi:sulfur carrier protein